MSNSRITFTILFLLLTMALNWYEMINLKVRIIELEQVISVKENP